MIRYVLKVKDYGYGEIPLQPVGYFRGVARVLLTIKNGVQKEKHHMDKKQSGTGHQTRKN